MSEPVSGADNSANLDEPEVVSQSVSNVEATQTKSEVLEELRNSDATFEVVENESQNLDANEISSSDNEPEPAPVEEEKAPELVPEPVKSEPITESSPPPPPTPQIPDSIPLGQLNLNLLPPYTDPSIKQLQLNLSAPMLNQLELSATLQELYQGEISAQEYETIYQIGVLFGSLPQIQHLGLLSGTLTVSSTEPIRLEELSNITTWKRVQFQLAQASADAMLVGRVEKDAAAGGELSRYHTEIAFQAGSRVSGNYKLQMELPLNTSSETTCPWIILDHELVTKPAEILYFHSYIDHICADDDDKMNIEIDLRSAAWPLANFQLNQTFNFGTVGDETMQATHPLFDIAISGFWTGDSVYSKTLKLNPTAIGSHLLPYLPNNFKAIFSRVQWADGASKSYTVNIEKSPETDTTTPDRLSLSSLVVKITGAFISATTIVLSANGALLSGALSQLESIIDAAISTIEQPSAIPLDIWQYQLAVEILIFFILILLLIGLLLITDLLDTVIRLSLIVLFVEICVATIGVQLITMGLL